MKNVPSGKENRHKEGISLIYISERILNIRDLEKEIQNATIHFNILERELKKATPSSEVIDAAAYQVSQSLAKANDFEFCLEQRKCTMIKGACDNPR